MLLRSTIFRIMSAWMTIKDRPLVAIGTALIAISRPRDSTWRVEQFCTACCWLADASKIETSRVFESFSMWYRDTFPSWKFLSWNFPFQLGNKFFKLLPFLLFSLRRSSFKLRIEIFGFSNFLLCAPHRTNNSARFPGEFLKMLT